MRRIATDGVSKHANPGRVEESPSTPCPCLPYSVLEAGGLSRVGLRTRFYVCLAVTHSHAGIYPSTAKRPASCRGGKRPARTAWETSGPFCIKRTQHRPQRPASVLIPHGLETIGRPPDERRGQSCEIYESLGGSDFGQIAAPSMAIITSGATMHQCFVFGPGHIGLPNKPKTASGPALHRVR
ncbi:hypothetical protein LX32DRAFT_329524 [Colletotrichum zoysiae]|uniref:Uncharacterized protein n=1 Tax=Colletotrichum zoysiae TaxID=1216348 RepID=A0AAD9M6J0_9PEZI|nr:hypothetical protein LX32DRAFT_329524 [Colletotrichum zoysiae]